MVDELPKNQSELDALIEERVNAKVDELSKKHNEEMANLRVSHKKEIEKINNQSNLSAEEKAKALAEEKQKELESELNDLRSFKKNSVLKERLTKEGLPSFLANDSRLINAEDGELDKVIKVVKGEYDATLPKGNTHSTIVPTNTTAPQKGGDKGLDAFALSLEQTLKG